MTNTDMFKTTVEEDLKEILKCKIHILMVQEKNNQLCEANNKEIGRLTNVIENRELSLEESLSKSGEKKIETPAGYCAYRVMPDKWNYEEEKIIETVINLYPEMKPDLLKTTIAIKKELIKKLAYNGGLPVEILESVTHQPQEPKFNYKIKGGI